METPLPKSFDSVERYEHLMLKESLRKPYRFPIACKELSYIMKNAYSKFPKYLQTIIFQDTLIALSLLSEMQTQSAISSATSLLHSAESVLPKQKRILAVKEYKNAIVANKRKSKVTQEFQDLTILPEEILLHIFSLLDMQSLLSASAVCWSWNTAVKDDHLWKFLYITLFCNSFNISKKDGCSITNIEEKFSSSDVVDTGVGLQWRTAFKTAYEEIPSRKLKSNRGYCSSCSSIVWLTNGICQDKPCTKDCSNHQIKAIATQQIIHYIMDGSIYSESHLSLDSDDDDDDNEEGSMFKLWAYPKQISR